MSEEINELFFNNKESLFFSKWPKFNVNKIIKENINIPIQINGKVRDVLETPINTDESKIIELALKQEKIINQLKGKQLVKKIYIKDKILNLIVK